MIFLSNHPQIEECKLVEKMIPLTNGIIWIIASDGNLWRIDEALYKKDKGGYVPSFRFCSATW